MRLPTNPRKGQDCPKKPAGFYGSRSERTPMARPPQDRSLSREMFERVVVGFDGSQAGFDALAQAKRLLAPGGSLLAITAVYPEVAVRTGIHYGHFASLLRTEAREASERAEQMIADLRNGEARVVRGKAIPTLLSVSADVGADLLAVGTHGGSRAAGILLGSIATAMLHDAPCHPVDALVDASREADLLIVGSRGLHGLAALGSVSERVAHRAECSVLVVRPVADRRRPGRPLEVEAST